MARTPPTPRPPPPPGAYEPHGLASPSRLPARWAERETPLAEGGPAPGPLGAPPPVGTGFRRSDLWRGFGLAALAFIVLFAIGIGLFEALEPDPSENVEDVGISLIVFVVDIIALIVVPIAVLGGRRRAPPLLGLRRPTRATAGWAGAALAGSYIALWIYLGIVAALDIEDLEPVSAIDSDLPFSLEAAVLTGILVVLVAPVAEEIFHRGFLVGALARLWGRWVAVLVSAATFAALHVDVGSLIPFFFVGVVFALVYLRSRDLGATILAHLLFNLIAFAVTASERGIA